MDLAAQLGLRKQHVFKVLRRLGIESTRRPGTNSRGQRISYISQEDARAVVEAVRSARPSSAPQGQDSRSIAEAVLDERGVFYLLALEPSSDPGRFKVGFAASLPERLRHLRCSAPLAELIATWPCKRLWERTAIDCLADGCERIHTGVFRAASLATIRDRCERFFAQMPRLATTGESTLPMGAIAGRPLLR